MRARDAIYASDDYARVYLSMRALLIDALPRADDALYARVIWRSRARAFRAYDTRVMRALLMPFTF